MNPPDHEQRKLIVERLDTTMLVEAAAGTGKTTAMVNRMIALVTAGKCRVDEMAAVTFTRKAAAELQEKFRAELTKLGLEGVDSCFIGTVHSFCARLLRERPVEAGVDLTFDELDEERDARLRERAWEIFGNELFARDDPLLEALDELGLDLAELRGAFLEFAEYPDVRDWPAEITPVPALEPATEALRQYAEHMRRVLPNEDGTDDLLGIFRRVLRMMRSYDLDRPADVAELFVPFAPNRKCVQKNWPDGKEQALREHQRWNTFCRDVAEPFLAAWRAHRYPTVLRVLRQACAEYDRVRAAEHGLNFQDLLLRAAALLRDHPETREFFRRRFRRILVDEFQDTDPVQAEMLFLLTADDVRERNWRKCRPAPGALFVVGDPKQSIYRFRRADIVTYNAVKDIITATGGVCVNLTANFRSAKPVVDWVNETCGAFFPPVADDFSPGYAPLEVARRDAVVSSDVLRIVSPSTLTNQDECANYEADLMARHIRSEIDCGRRTANDFLIVTRTKKRLSVYAAALQRLQIPHEVTGGRSLNEVHELELLHTALRAALEPDNPVALIAALRSELFGFSDQELYAFRRAGGQFDFRVPTAAEPFRDAFAALAGYAETLANVSPMIAMERIAADLGLLALAAAGPGGDVESGSFAKAIELLRAAQVDSATATELVAQLGRLVEQAELYDGMPATAPSPDVVRLMNLHQVKGLEASVVFLADPSGASDHDIKLHIDRRQERAVGYLAVYGEPNAWGQAVLLAHPVGWEEWAARERQFLQAENHRLLYVAVTRARDRLIVSLRAKRSDANPWQALAGNLQECPQVADPGPQGEPAVVEETLAPQEVASAQNRTDLRWKEVLRPTYDVRAAKQVNFPMDRLTMAMPDDARGMRWGGVIHSLLQAAMKVSPKTDWEALAPALLQAAGLEVVLVADAVAIVRNVMQSPIWQRAVHSQQRLTELPFVIRDAGDGALVRGVIDLAFEESDGWVIVDYKTDRVRKQLEKTAEAYRLQLGAYRTAWTQFQQQPPKEVGLYFTYANQYVKMF